MKPKAQTAALAAIGIADLVSTLMFIGVANAAEANPLMAWFLDHGPAAFIQAKLFLLVVPIGALEFARLRNPTFVRRAVNVAIVGYVGLYSVGVVHINHRPHDGKLTAPPAVQANIDETRKRLGLPPAPPLKLLVRAAAQKSQPAVYVPLYYSKPLPAPLSSLADGDRVIPTTEAPLAPRAPHVEYDSGFVGRALDSASRTLTGIAPMHGTL